MLERTRGILRGWLGEPRALTPAQMFGADYYDDDELYPSGERITQRNATSLATVYACQTLIADIVSTLPIDVMRKVDGAPAPVKIQPSWLTSPVPNDPSVTRAAHFAQVSLSLLADGNAFVHVAPHVLDPQVLTVLDPRAVQIRRDGGLRPIYRVSNFDGTGSREFTADNIIHIPRTSRPGMDRGLSPIDEAALPLGTFMAATKHAARFYRNGALLSTILEVPGEMEKTDAIALRDGFDEAHTGSNVFKTAVLTGGAKASTLGVTPEQSLFLETLKYGTLEVCRLYRVPPMLVGVNEPGSVSYASAVEAVRAFAVNTLAPFIKVIELGYGRLLPDPASTLVIDMNGLLRGDPKTRYDGYAIGLEKGFLSRDEVRAWEELPPMGGKAGAVFTVQAQMTDLQTIADPPPPPPVQAPPEPAEDEPTPEDQSTNTLRMLASLLEDRYSPNQPRGKDGKWHSVGGGGGGSGTVGSYAGLAQQAIDGGFTVSLHGSTPSTGFVVSPYKGSERVFSASSFGRNDVHAFRDANAELLRKKNHYIGGWRDGDNVYLDVSVRAPDRATAGRLARENNQIAVYDIGSGTAILTADLGGE